MCTLVSLRFTQVRHSAGRLQAHRRGCHSEAAATVVMLPVPLVPHWCVLKSQAGGPTLSQYSPVVALLHIRPRPSCAAPPLSALAAQAQLVWPTPASMCTATQQPWAVQYRRQTWWRQLYSSLGLRCNKLHSIPCETMAGHCWEVGGCAVAECLTDRPNVVPGALLLCSRHLLCHLAC